MAESKTIKASLNGPFPGENYSMWVRYGEVDIFLEPHEPAAAVETGPLDITAFKRPPRRKERYRFLYIKKGIAYYDRVL